MLRLKIRQQTETRETTRTNTTQHNTTQQPQKKEEQKEEPFGTALTKLLNDRVTTAVVVRNYISTEWH